MLHLNPILKCLESNEATTLTTDVHLKINLQMPPKFTLYVVEQTYWCSKLAPLTANYRPKPPLISHKLLPWIVHW